MRRRGVRVFVLIFIILVISIAALSFRNINISIGGASIESEGSGPLGLELDLELQGGSHLVYQADLPDEAIVTFQGPVEEARLRAVLDDLGHNDAVVSKSGFLIQDLALTERSQTELIFALSSVAPISDSAFLTGDATGDGVLEVTFQDVPTTGDLRLTLDNLGQTEAAIESLDTPEDTRSFAINGLSLDDEGAEEDLRAALAGLTPIQDFTAGDGTVEVTFGIFPGPEDISMALDNLGYTEAVITEGTEVRRFTIRGLALAERARRELISTLGELEDIVDSSFIAVGTGDEIEGLEITFQDTLIESDIRSLLNITGYGDAAISVPAQAYFTVRELEIDDDADQEVLQTALMDLAPVDVFDLDIRSPDEDQMDGVVNTIQQRINALGTTGAIIQNLGNDRVLVQLPGAGGSTLDLAFQPVLEMLAQIVSEMEALVGAGSNLEQGIGDSFIVTTGQPVTTDDREEIEGFARSLSPAIDFEGTGDRTFTITFPPQTRIFITELLQGEGLEGFDVQEGEEPGGFIIRTDESIGFEDQERLENTLANRVAPIRFLTSAGGVDEAKDLIGRTAQLVFMERTCLDPSEALISSPGLCQPVSLGGQGRFTDEAIGVTTDRPDGLTGQDLARAFRSRDNITNEPIVNLEFNSRGTRIWSDLTRRLAGDQTKRVAIFRDGEQLTAPVVTSHIPDGFAVISGSFTSESARTLAIQLESGRLPVPLKLIRERTVDALLGADSLRKSLIAGLVGLGLVLLFMVLYYRFAGVVAAVALIIYAIIVLAIFKLAPVPPLSLSGVAGLVLSIGMAVDANILIFERMKEELRTGRSLTSSMEVGYRRAWVAIRDSNISTIITCAILFLFGSRLGAGTPVVTAFSITLLIGVAVSMFTALTVSRNLLQLVAWTPMGRRMDLFTPEPTRRQPVRVAGGGE